VQNAPAAVAQGQKQEAGAAQERPATASLEVNTGAALRAPVTVTQKETRKQRARRAKREKRGEVSPNIGVETTAQDVDAQVLKNEADRLAGAHEGSELARAAEAAMEEAAAQVEATAQAESHPSMGVENTAQVEAQVLALAGCASHSNTGRGGLPQFGG
jgi:hypothetical protein